MTEERNKHNNSSEHAKESYVHKAKRSSKKVTFGGHTIKHYNFKVAHENNAFHDTLYENTDKKNHATQLREREEYSKTLRYYQNELEEIGVPYSNNSHRIARKIYKQEYNNTGEFVKDVVKIGVGKGMSF